MPTVSTTEALTLVLAPERPQLVAGTLPDLKATIRNAGTKPARLCTYMLRYRLMLAMVAKDEQGLDYGLYPFRTGKFDAWKNDDVRTLAPGELVTETLALSKAEGWGFVRTGSQPPLLAPRHAVAGFPAGTHTFSTLLFSSMAVYTGQDGFYDFTLTPRAIPQEIPGAKYPPDLFSGDLRASVKVRFVPGKK